MWQPQGRFKRKCFARIDKSKSWSLESKLAIKKSTPCVVCGEIWLSTCEAEELVLKMLECPISVASRRRFLRKNLGRLPRSWYMVCPYVFHIYNRTCTCIYVYSSNMCMSIYIHTVANEYIIYIYICYTPPRSVPMRNLPHNYNPPATDLGRGVYHIYIYWGIPKFLG